MKVTRKQATSKGNEAWFTGDVYIDSVAAPEPGSDVLTALVHFTPGARTAWHTHPHGQSIYVVEGIGWVQRRGETKVEVRPGDRVLFEPGEDHWHGAAADHFMAHMAVVQVDAEGKSSDWGDLVTDEDYLS